MVQYLLTHKYGFVPIAKETDAKAIAHARSLRNLQSMWEMKLLKIEYTELSMEVDP